MRTRNGRRMVLVVVGAMMMALLPLAASANHINDHRNIILPDPNPNGPTEWSIRWSSETFTNAPRVLIGRADDFADALASGGLQGSTTPLLLTDRDTLSDGIAEEMDRLRTLTFDVVGGEQAVSQAVVDQLSDEGFQFGQRFEGPTRFETATAIAGSLLLIPTDTVLIVRGEGADEPTQGFADSLAAGGWAADEGWPVLLTQTDVLHPSIEDFLDTRPNIRNAIIVGGDQAVGGTNEAELTELGLTVTRVSGTNRAATAIAVAQERGFDDVSDADRFLVVESERDDAYALGFPAAAHSAAAGAPIILLADGEIPAETAAWLAPGNAERSEDVMTGDPLFICAAAPPACAGPVRAAIDLPTVGNNGADVTLDTDDAPFDTGAVLTGSAIFDTDFEAGFALTGPCIDDGDVDVAADGTFTTEITSTDTDEDADADADVCTIRYLVTYDNGTTQVGMFPVTLTGEGDGNGGGGGGIPGLPLPIPIPPLS
ncbi:hypothetical protein BH23ACT9_BH23ACT9_37860 [soil metagenome]